MGMGGVGRGAVGWFDKKTLITLKNKLVGGQGFIETVPPSYFHPLATH